MNNANTNQKTQNDLTGIIVQEVIRGVFTLIPIIAAWIISHKKKKTNPNNETAEEFNNDFDTGHDWSKKE